MMRLSTRFYFRVAVLLLMLNFTAGGCEDDAVGLTDSAKIANNKFSSSSNLNASTPASNGRLSYTGGPSWCAVSSDSTPYLEVDLGSVYILCAVATQGNSQADQWVKTYEIKSSKDNSSWTPYKEKGQDVIFQGNYDRNTEVKHYFYEGLQAWYVRVYPKRHYGLVCLRLELFGQSKTDCSSTAIGVEDSSKIPNDRFTASSKLNYPVFEFWNARLNHKIGWTPLSRQNVQNEWIQIDFGSSYFICAVATQGSGLHNEYVTKYKLKLSSNNKDWTYYTEGGTVREFIGNENRNQIKKNSLSDNVFGKFLRLTPLTFLNWPTLRMEVYGITQVCRSSLGMENRSIPDSQITASTDHDTAANGRLYNNGSAWCGTTLSTDYLQVDLGQSVTVTGLATQGDPSASHWVKRYLVKYSHDTTTWYDYKENGQNTKSFSGNTNQNSLFVNWFNNYVFARYIRVYPTSANGNPCLRVDFYGCIGVVAKPLVLLEDLFVSSLHSTIHLVCKITGQLRPEFQWQYKGNSISSSDSTTNGIITTTHTISYTDAATVMLDHVCHRVNISTRHANCSSPPYVCKARYAGGKFAGKSTVVIVNLLTPDAVSDLAVESSTDDSATLKWSQPSSSGDMPVTSYKMEYSEALDGATTKTSTTTATSHVITGLKPYTNYSIRVMARSIIGEGLWSAPFQFTTDQAAPTKPINLVLTSDSKHPRVTISWKAPTSPNGVITRYTVYYRYLPKGNVSTVSVKAEIMAVTVDIIGGMKYRFEVTATTVAEGAEEMADKTLPEYAPDAAPRNFAFRHFNATTYNCSWDPPPREKSHGKIAKYDVSYTSQPTTRRKRSSEAVSVTTTNTHTLLYNLKLCKRFNISVRAWTSAGPGPYSKELSLENAAMPPQKVEASKAGSKKVEVVWTEPPRLGGEIKGYKVKFKGTKSYNDSFLHKGEKETSRREPTQLVVEGLVPGTAYEFEVATKAGCSEVAYSVVKARAETDVANPLPAKVEMKDDANAGNQFTVTFSAAEMKNGPISFYQIIVLRVEDASTILPENYENELNNVTTAEALGLPFYISAEIPEKNVTSNTSFVVGDETIHGSYLNARLRGGMKYSVFVRTITVYRAKMYASGPAKLAEITVRKESASGEKRDGGPVSTIIGVIVALLLVLVIAVLVVVYLRRRKHSKESRQSYGKQTVPMRSLESQENGSSSLHLVRGEDDIALGGKEAVDTAAEVKPETSYAAPKNKDSSKVPLKDDSQPIYCNAMGEEERKAIPVVQFSEYMNRVKLGDYARLRQEYQTFPKLKQFPWTEAEKPANKKFNRYGNIIAYDHTRVVLEDYEETDYINASYIHGWDETPQVYIATQGPVQSSVASFWFMIWNQNVSIIVMTTNLVEGGKKKCVQYWPDSTATHGQFEVTLMKSDVFADFTIRTLKLSKGTESRTVTHFHFTVWPDHGVPRLPSNIISLRRRVRSRTTPDTGPTVVHCSAGVGRTGTYIVIDAMLEQAKKEKKVDIYSYLTVIRNDRIQMVQTDDQYVFIHKAILEALTCGNTELDLRKHNIRLAMKKLEKVNQTHGKTGFEMEFERLGFVCPDASADECEVAHRPENKSKNRNLAFAPLDISRVILSRPTRGEHNDYINASFADAFRERNGFIMTQAPLPHTKEDFWQTVYQSSVGCVVMLNSTEEGSESYPKYWPNATSTEKKFGNITVSLQTEDFAGDVIKRKFRVSKSQGNEQPLIVRHLQYTAWPDHSVPRDHLSVIKLLTEVQNASQLSGKVNMVVHCSDGVGRSGTFCAIYSILERVKLEQVLDVFQAIKDIRVRRPSAVETPEQYKFCYRIVQAYLDSFSDYANFSDC